MATANPTKILGAILAAFLVLGFLPLSALGATASNDLQIRNINGLWTTVEVGQGISVSAEVYNSAAYTANVTLNIATVGANVGQFQLTILDAASARHKKMLVNTSVNTEIIANAAVEVKTVGGNPATGDSDIIVFATYYIYDLI